MEKIDVLEKILLADNVEKSLKENEATIFEMIPLLQYEKDFDQKSEWHAYDVWNHTIKAVASSEKDFDIRLVMLLHDIGKPFSYQEDGDIRHFHGHANKSMELSEGILTQLGYSGEELERMLFLIGAHASQIEIDKIDDSNRDFYDQLIKIQIYDASAYEKSHGEMVINRLLEIQEQLKKEKVKSL